MADPANNPGLVSDCDALLAARDTLAGTATLNWSVSKPIDLWEGITVAGSPPRVTELKLPDKGLTGEIPAELGSLANLQSLYLSNNQLTGEIPKDLGSLSNLQSLYLFNNQLTGEIPAELGSLANLQSLYLSNNQLTGEIPKELGNLAYLEVLRLNGNSSLSGTLPGSFTGLTALTRLHLQGTQLCAPTDAAFQAWLRGVVNRSGVVNCAAAEVSPDRAALVAFYTALLQQFTDLHGIGAAALGIMRQGEIVYEGAVGHMDDQRRVPVRQDIMMRVASVSKPITAAAVRKLESDGMLALDDRVFDLGQSGGGLLEIDPFPQLGDPRLADITVLHLLQHRGGWDRDVATDFVFREIEIAEAMSVASPPGRENTVRYVLGQPLQFSPGSRSAYSNVGYLVLGLVIEEVSGQDYMTYVRENIFAPLGVPIGDVIQGRTFPKDRSEREPWYDAEGKGRNVFDPSGPRVRWPDGGWHHEAAIAQGGLVASTRAILEFLNAYIVIGDDIGRRRSGREGSGWWWVHTGSIEGTNSLALQRGDGINYVVLFNRRASSGPSYVELFMEIMEEQLAGCIPGEFRDVAENDLGDIDLPFCDVLLSGLTVSPGSLVPQFDPYRTDYSASVGLSPVTVTLAATNDYSAAFQFLDENDLALADADRTLAGFQVEFGAGVPAINIRVVSQDNQATHTYTITDLGNRYDANDDRVIRRDEVITAIKDYFNDVITREETIEVIKLYFSG